MRDVNSAFNYADAPLKPLADGSAAAPPPEKRPRVYILPLQRHYTQSASEHDDVEPIHLKAVYQTLIVCTDESIAYIALTLSRHH